MEPMPAEELHTLWSFSDPAASEERFRFQLEHASGDDALEYRTQLARTFSLRKRCDEAHAELDTVQASLDGASGKVRVRYHLERGRTFRTGGEPAKALPEFEQAYTAAVAVGDENLAIDAAHMVAITEGGDRVWHTRALDAARAATDDQARRWLPSLLNNYAWSLHDGGKLEEALAVFQEAEVVFEQGGHIRRLAVAKWSVGRCLRSMGRIGEAWAIQSALIEGNDGYVYEELGELALLRDEPASDWFAKAHAALKDEGLPEERLARMARLALA